MKRAELIFRRLVSAGPEFVLAWLSYSSARDVLAGNPVDGYVLGVVFIELMGLTWIRFALLNRDKEGMFSSLLGLGRTVVALFSLVFQAVFGLIALIVILAIDAELFLLLVVAAFRRSLWIWSWDLAHVHSRMELRAHYRRLRYAHAFALAMAALFSAMMYLLLDLTPADAVLGDALYMTGLAGYFMTLGIYQLAGRMPLVDEEENETADPVSRRTIPLPDIAGIMDTFKREWMTFLPDILILWVIMSLAQAVMDPDLFTTFLPLIASAAALVLLSSAAFSLGSSRDSPIGHAWARRGPCLYATGAINLLVLLLFGLSLPLVAGLLGLDIEADVLIGNTAFMSVMLGVALLLLCLMIRLWPALVLPLMMDRQDVPPPIPDLLKLAWRLTRGPDGFIRAGAAPLVVLTPMLLLSLPDGPWGIAGLFVNYLVLAPLAAVVMVERTLVMLQVRGTVAFRDQTAADELVEREYQLDAAGGGVIPVPVPVPTAVARVEEVRYGSTDQDDASPEDRLFTAIWSGNLKGVVDCLDAGVSADAVRDGDPAIMHAANRGYGDIVRLLLNRGANPHAPNRFDTTLLHECVGADLSGLVIDLVDRYGFDVNVTDSNGATPLMRAMSRASFEVGQRLLERGADPLAQDVNGRDALVYLVSSVSAFTGNASPAPDSHSFLARLLDAQADLSPDNAALQLAVDEAAGRGRGGVLQVLHNHGVDLSRPSAGITAMQRAAANGHRETVQALLKMGVPMDIHAAILVGDRQAVADMLEQQPALVDARPGSGTLAALKPPIYQAMAAGDADLVKMLIEQGADSSDASPGWLYFLASHMHDGEIAQMMVDRGADIECVDGDRNTALNIAARYNNLPVARVLLDAGADPNARTERGYFVRAWAKKPEMDALIESYGGRYEGGPY